MVLLHAVACSAGDVQGLKPASFYRRVMRLPFVRPFDPSTSLRTGKLRRASGRAAARYLPIFLFWFSAPSAENQNINRIVPRFPPLVELGNRPTRGCRRLKNVAVCVRTV